MNKGKRIGRILLCLIVSFVMVLTLIPRMPANLAYAAAGQEPEHAKILQKNEDGTYTIALNIKGDSEKKPNPVNVIVIIDRSGSMDESTGNTEVTYTPTNSDGGWFYQNNLYGLVNGEYVQLTRTSSGSGWSTTYTFYANGQEYTGQRYTRQTANQDRLEAAQEAANQLASALLAHNGQDGNADDTVEIALVSFSTHATTDVSPTTSYSTFENGVNALNHNGGTNWEAAFSEASDVNFNDNDPTYVIFLSDGLPTFRDSANGYTQDYRAQDGVYGDGQEGTQNVNRCYAPALTAAQSLLSDDATSNTAAERFYTIFAYGGNAGATRLNQLTTGAGAPAENNYSAENTAQLQQAFADILEAIEMAGIGNVDMEDGTTSNVSTDSGTAHLLDVADPSTFKYYRAGGTDENGNEKYKSDANTITDPDGNVTNIGEEWADAPAATFEDGAVKWDLGDDFLLENGVTYTVTFDCWPSQETLDHIASIKNDSTYYDSLDDNIKNYLEENGNLKTNTSATLSYEDTRTDESEKDNPITYDNPKPVSTSAVEQLAVSKEWKNELEENWDKPDEIVLDVTRDGENTYTATLNDGNDWTDGVYISIGIMRTSGEGEDEEIELLTSGHNFTFAEPGAASGYKWELNVPTVRPMKINGTDTILVLVDEDHPAPEGAKTYTLPDKDGVAGGTYYVDNEMVSLTATNERRSSVNLTKVVTGEDVPEDAVFPFTVNIVDSLAPAEAPSEAEDPDHDSDYWVWISVRDKDGTRINEGVTGATSAGNGWWYAASGSDVTIPVKAGYSIRFNNLPVGSTYTITEGDLPNGFIFDDATIEIQEGIGTKTDSFEVTKDTKTASGTVQETNTLYKVTMTNKYELIDINVDKVWDDGSDKDGFRPDELTLTLNGLPTGTTAPTPEIEVSEDGNTWTYTWKAVPRYDSEGNELEYTVTENNVPEGYTCEETTAEDGGTITNVHTVEPTTATITKVWDDEDDQDGIRPENLVITLLADGEDETTVTLNDDNEWTATVTGLDKYADGEEITYTWTEKTVPDGYEVSYGEGNENAAPNGGTITNTHEPEQTEATVKKVWDDEDDQDGFRPESLTVTLLADGEETDQTVTLNEENEWTATIDELDKYADGEEITYSWKEGDIDKYTLSDSSKEGTVTTLKNSHTPEKVVVEVEKVWEDAKNQDGKRPDSVTVKLLADGEDTDKTLVLNENNNWKGSFEDLDKYADGNEIKYTVEEVEVPEGYKADVTGNAVPATEEDSDKPEAIGYIVTNTHEPEVVTITVKKVWDDADDQDGFRPDSITVSLLADGKDTGKTVALNEGNQWTNTFEGADLYKYAVGKEGVEVEYTVKEPEVADGYKVAIAGSVEDGFTVTNSHTPEKVEVSVEKTWDDADDRDGIRPDSVTVKLLANGDDAEVEDAVVELNEKNNWKYTWTDLDKREAGQEISYTVEEEPVEDYEPETTGDAETGYTIKNIHQAKPEPVMSDPPVQKIVKGNPSTDETFTFQMKALTDGAPMPEGSKDGVKTVQITGSGSYEFGEMWFSEAGTYKYEISEVDTGAKNYTYDTTKYTLTVEVKEEKVGNQVKLTKTETVEGGDGQIVFTNTYEEPPVKMGDTTIVMPYIVIGVSALVLLLMLLLKGRKSRA